MVEKNIFVHVFTMNKLSIWDYARASGGQRNGGLARRLNGQ